MTRDDGGGVVVIEAFMAGLRRDALLAPPGASSSDLLCG